MSRRFGEGMSRWQPTATGPYFWFYELAIWHVIIHLCTCVSRNSKLECLILFDVKTMLFSAVLVLMCCCSGAVVLLYMHFWCCCATIYALLVLMCCYFGPVVCL